MNSRIVLLAALLLSSPALADTPIDQTHPLSPTGQVSIDNIKGRIVVVGWNRPEVRITGTLGEGVEKLEVEGSGDSLRIEVKYPSSGGGWFNWGGGNRGKPSVVEVSMPATASLSVDSVSAGVDVSGMRGRRLSVDSVSGDVRVRGAGPGQGRFDSVSGGLDLELDSRDVEADTVSGDIRLRGGIGGRVSLDTVSGNASLEAGTLERLSLSSVSGNGRLRAGLAEGGSISADTVSGRLSLDLPADTSARLRVETFSGDITSPVGTVQTQQYGPGKSLDARLGDGSGDIRLESFSGSVRVTLE
jgi:DUF4097 and DUF4098 domain-containing protein YvlB